MTGPTISTPSNLFVARIGRLWQSGEREAALRIARAQAEDGDREIQHLLATLLSEGDTLDQAALAEAVHWYERAAEQGLPDDLLRAEWLILWNTPKGEGWNPLDRYRKAARAGSRTASRNLIVLIGSDVVHGEDHEGGFLGYLQDHAEDGFDDAQFLLGKCYDCGFLGAQPDHRLAFHWYLRAAQQGHPWAQCYLGILYARGIGVDRDDHQAVAWYQRAASQGNAQAQCNLGYSYEIGRGPLTASMEEANRWYRLSAMGGYDQGQFNLAMSYRYGRCLPRNDAMAAKWYASAAEQGNESAQYELGRCYELGEGVEKNKELSVSWCRAAAEKGHARAQYRLGVMYAVGWGVPMDKRQAYYWSLLAAACGEAEAIPCRDEVARLLPNAERALVQAEARKWRSSMIHVGGSGLIEPVFEPEVVHPVQRAKVPGLRANPAWRWLPLFSFLSFFGWHHFAR